MEFTPNPKCKYCKGTGMVELATSSKPCLDCKKSIPIQQVLDEIDIILNPIPLKMDDFGGHNNI